MKWDFQKWKRTRFKVMLLTPPQHKLLLFNGSFFPKIPQEEYISKLHSLQLPEKASLQPSKDDHRTRISSLTLVISKPLSKNSPPSVFFSHSLKITLSSSFPPELPREKMPCSNPPSSLNNQTKAPPLKRSLQPSLKATTVLPPAGDAPLSNRMHPFCISSHRCRLLIAHQKVLSDSMAAN